MVYFGLQDHFLTCLYKVEWNGHETAEYKDQTKEQLQVLFMSSVTRFSICCLLFTWLLALYSLLSLLCGVEDKRHEVGHYQDGAKR